MFFRKRSKNVRIKPFHTTGLFLYAWEHQKIKGFLMFSGGIERDQRHEMGNYFNNHFDNEMIRKQNEYFKKCNSTYCIPIDNVNILRKATVDML